MNVLKNKLTLLCFATLGLASCTAGVIAPTEGGGSQFADVGMTFQGLDPRLNVIEMRLESATPECASSNLSKVEKLDDDKRKNGITFKTSVMNACDYFLRIDTGVVDAAFAGTKIPDQEIMYSNAVYINSKPEEAKGQKVLSVDLKKAASLSVKVVLLLTPKGKENGFPEGSISSVDETNINADVSIGNTGDPKLLCDTTRLGFEVVPKKVKNQTGDEIHLFEVTKVTAGSEAEKAGLLPGMVIELVNGKRYTNAADLYKAICDFEKGVDVTIDARDPKTNAEKEFDVKPV